jgi:hypothetical protein
MSKLTVEQIRMLKDLTGDDYGFNGKKLTSPRNIYSKYLTGIMTIKEILIYEQELNYLAMECFITPDNADKIYYQIYKSTERAMKDRGIADNDNSIFGSVQQFKRKILRGELE